MKGINYKTNKPLFLGVLGNALYLTLSQTDFAATAPGQMFRGALVGFALAAYLVGLWNMNHETPICSWKKKLFHK